MKKHTLTAALLLLAALITSCGSTPSDTTEPAETNSTSQSETADVTEVVTEDHFKNLPAQTWDGETVTMLVRTEFLYEFSAEESGEIVEDAIFLRNAKIEERYNINLEIMDQTGTFSTKNVFLKTMNASIMAQDGAYDIVAAAANYLLPEIPKNSFRDLYEVPHVDLTQPWWAQGYVENMSIDGALYLATGSAAINVLENMCVMFFNKQLVGNYDLPDPYALVESGEWTYDALMSMAKAAAGDMDGDGKMGENDRIGFLTYGNMTNVQPISLGCDYSRRGEDGYPMLTFYTDRMTEAYDKVSALYSDISCWNYASGGDTMTLQREMQELFKNGNTLLMAQVLSSAEVMRDMDIDFGIIPMPKLNAEQERYYTTAMENLTVLGVLTSTDNDELAGAVLETLAIDGYANVTPVYFERALKGKYARDDESAEMLSLIRDSLWFDFAYLNSTSLNDINHIFRGAVEKGTGIASAFEKKKSTIEKSLEKLLDKYRELADL